MTRKDWERIRQETRCATRESSASSRSRNSSENDREYDEVEVTVRGTDLIGNRLDQVVTIWSPFADPRADADRGACPSRAIATRSSPARNLDDLDRVAAPRDPVSRLPR
jgi:hypothetical protein